MFRGSAWAFFHQAAGYVAATTRSRRLKALGWSVLRRTLPPSFVDDAGDLTRDFRRQVREHWFPLVTEGIRLEGPEARKRMVADGVASRAECRDLIELASARVEPGGGYRGNPHPHNQDETFSGFDFPGGIDGEDPRTALAGELAERSRTRIMTYFGISELWLGYLHLVRRTVIAESIPAPLPELSHDWHSDNPGQFWWRSHSAILFLNDDFDGGEFLFREDETTPRRRIRPKPGRLVAFTGSEENVHAVSKLIGGERFVLAMWFSVSPLARPRHQRIFTARRP